MTCGPAVGASSPGRAKVTSSMYGRCGSSNVVPDSSPSSASEPMHTIRDGSASLRQIGSGVPQ